MQVSVHIGLPTGTEQGKKISLKIDKVIQNKSLKFYKDNIFKFQTWILEIELGLHTPQPFTTSLYKIKVLFSLSLKLNPKITLDHHYTTSQPPTTTKVLGLVWG